MPTGGLTPDSPMFWMGGTHGVSWVLAILANEEFTLLILALGLVKDRSPEKKGNALKAASHSSDCFSSSSSVVSSQFYLFLYILISE